MESCGSGNGRGNFNQEEAEEIMDYECDRDVAGYFSNAFCGKRRKACAFKSFLAIARKTGIAVKFSLNRVGCTAKEMVFTPMTGVEHCLKILSCEAQSMPEDAWRFQSPMNILKIYSINVQLSRS